MEAFLFLVLVAVGYFIPCLIAQMRGHPDTNSIFALNLLAGWTGLGWLIAIVWALKSLPQPMQAVTNISLTQEPPKIQDAPAPAAQDVMAQIKDLAAMRDKGDISQQEYDTLKAKLL